MEICIPFACICQFGSVSALGKGRGLGTIDLTKSAFRSPNLTHVPIFITPFFTCYIVFFVVGLLSANPLGLKKRVDASLKP